MAAYLIRRRILNTQGNAEVQVLEYFLVIHEYWIHGC